jgi:hypothetical protein
MLNRISARCWVVGFRLQCRKRNFLQRIEAFASEAVAAAARVSHATFQGLAGLPLLRLLRYGGNADEFWLQSPANTANAR